MAKIYTTKVLNWTNETITVLEIKIFQDKLSLRNANYEGTITQIETTLNSWSHRNLSLLGKVIMLNSLIGSLFVYKMNILPSLMKTMIN